MLVHAEGLSQAEAAQIMGCKEVTVAWHIHKARKTLRGCCDKPAVRSA